MVSLTGAIPIPIQERVTRPSRSSIGRICWTMAIGMAKPMPCPCALIAVLMPMTRPLVSSSGPPLLPGLIDASVWRNE